MYITAKYMIELTRSVRRPRALYFIRTERTKSHYPFITWPN